jgi:hypothetical protein
MEEIDMSSAVLWKLIVERTTQSDLEIPTVPLVRRAPLWFRIRSNANAVYINQARENTPSSTLKMPRTITYQEFERIYPYYEQRLKGTAVSQEAASKSVNTVYIYAMIAYAISQQE